MENTMILLIVTLFFLLFAVLFMVIVITNQTAHRPLLQNFSDDFEYVIYCVNLSAEEIYAKLEQVSPAHVLMETAIEEGVFPQCFEVITPWGGKLVHFIPGHAPEVTANPVIINNICEIIYYLEKR